KPLTRFEFPCSSLLDSRGQVHRITRPRFDNQMMVAAPAAVDHPHPEVRTQVNGKRQQKTVTRRLVFHRVPSRIEFRSVVTAEDTGVNGLCATHIRCTARGLE